MFATNRRLQCNLSNIGPDDEPTLLRCKLDVDAEIERQRWSMVAKAMVEAGCEEYEVSSSSFSPSEQLAPRWLFLFVLLLGDLSLAVG